MEKNKKECKKKRNPQKFKKVKEILQRLEADPKYKVYYADESGFSLIPSVLTPPRNNKIYVIMKVLLKIKEIGKRKYSDNKRSFS